MRAIAFLLGLLVLGVASASSAVTLTVTPDESVYPVGEEITLSVFGDAMGVVGGRIRGRLLFDAGLAEPVSSTQTPLTYFSGLFTWITDSLESGPGFADAFTQVALDGNVPDAPLSATVVLRATAPGVLSFDWQTEGDNNDALFFFDLTSAPGGSVTIVPEPATLSLLGLGLLALALRR